MASQYYLHNEGKETGPFGFRDLVDLVREGKLRDSDLVRYSWTNEWKRADSLVGLFHMAQRRPKGLIEPNQSPDDSDSVGSVEPADPGSEEFNSRWSSTVDEALAKVTARQSSGRPDHGEGRWRNLFDRLLNTESINERGDSWLRIGYRIACTLIFAAIMAVSVENWSREEGRRFLRGESQKATVRMFPIVGKCGTGQYVFLMADLVLATATITWVVAGWLEALAE
jgi:hypothetical protein